MGIRAWLERRRIRKAFRQYVNPEVLAKLLKEPPPPRLETKHFQFVVILVDEANPKGIPDVIGRVVETVAKHRATIEGITSTLVVGLLGVPFLDGNSPEARRTLVDALLLENGDRLRIAHGEGDGPVGLLGSQTRMSYGALIPNFAGVLKSLLETKPGTAVEVF